MRTRTAMTVAGSAASLILLGGVAYAAVQSVDTQPGPQVVVPSSDDRTHARGGADDPANHDANDDNHRNRHRHGADDPATHDVNDDSGLDGSHSGTGSGGGGGTDDSGSGHGGHGGDD